MANILNTLHRQWELITKQCRQNVENVMWTLFQLLTRMLNFVSFAIIILNTGFYRGINLLKNSF